MSSGARAKPGRREQNPVWYYWHMGALRLIALDHEAPLDAYSRVVTDVARKLSPSVANLRVSRGRREGGGSGVVITPDGFVLTSAHVVEGSHRGVASFVDGRELTVEVVGVGSTLRPRRSAHRVERRDSRRAR